MIYVIPFLISFLLAAIFIFLGIYFGKKFNWKGRTALRHIHRLGTLRIGGAAMILAFNLAIILNPDLTITLPLFGVMLASIAILVIGIWDDLREMFWKTQFFFQVAIAILVFIMGVRIYFIANPMTGEIINFDNSAWLIFSVFLVILWIVLMINSLNWLDGIDGLSGGVTFICAITIFLLSLKPEVNQPPMAILSMILAGVSLAFLVFNFNPSHVLAGTSGSMFMGFSLAALAIFAGTKVATSILVMSLPIIDFLWVIGERLRDGKSIFKPDMYHLHYKLRVLGWSQKKTAIYFYLVTILASIVALNTRAISKGIAFFVVAVIISLSLAIVSKIIKKSAT